MVQKNILASILINNYNNQKFLKKSIFSCLNQTYKNLEIIIFDDNSTDNSLKILKKIKNSKSKGEIIFLLDSDDYFLKNKVELIVDLFKQEKNLNFVQDNPIYFYPSKNLQIKKKPKKKIFSNAYLAIY